MDHYFINNHNISHNRRELSFRFLGVDYCFMSDRGVFSKNDIDVGTQALLKQVCQETLSGTICDLGCGYGVMAIVLKKQFPHCDVLGIDVNTRAIDCALKSALKNKVTVSFIVQDGLKEEDACFDTIVCNPPIRAGKHVIYRLFLEMIAHLKPEGVLWLVMRKSHGVHSAIAFLKKQAMMTEIISKDKGFYVVKARVLI